MDIIIQGIIKGMEDMGCKLVKVDTNKLYFIIPKEFTDEKIKIAKEAINHYGYRLFTKRVSDKKKWEALGYSDNTMLIVLNTIRDNDYGGCIICGDNTSYIHALDGVRLCSVECADEYRVSRSK